MSEKERDYIPVSCTIYSGYELAIMHRQRLRVAWRDPDGGHHVGTLRPVDLETRDAQEFLIARTEAGQSVRLRLDWIRSSQGL